VAVTYRKWKKARVETESEWKCGAHMILTCASSVDGVAVTAVVAGPAASFCFRDRSTNRAPLFFRWRARGPASLCFCPVPSSCVYPSLVSFLQGGEKAILVAGAVHHQ
jgi:hypothetical protein